VAPLKSLVIILLVGLVVSSSSAVAEESDRGFRFELGKEYSDYNKPAGSKAGSKASSPSTWRTVLLYLPNRFLDLIDIVKIDLGAGIGYGGVVRPTKYLQFGYREMEPGMLRLGLMGRRAPALIEKKGESGFGRDFGRASKRKTSPGEFGVGLDLYLVGAYVGVSPDSAADFVLGIFGGDFEEDDLE